MIEVNEMSLIYPDGTIGLKEINLTIGTGELVYLTGVSGSGKTSLLKVLMGMEYPTAGKVTVLGTPILPQNSPGIKQLRQVIGPVFQSFKLIPGRTAMENVMVGMRFLDFTSYEIKQLAMEALAHVGLAEKAFSIVDKLSWGQCQRVAIARAIARRPRLILADEPTGNLDTENALNILSLFLSLKEQNTTVIITTHATHLIEGQIEGKIIHLEQGSLSEACLGAM